MIKVFTVFSILMALFLASCGGSTSTPFNTPRTITPIDPQAVPDKILRVMIVDISVPPFIKTPVDEVQDFAQYNQSFFEKAKNSYNEYIQDPELALRGMNDERVGAINSLLPELKRKELLLMPVVKAFEHAPNFTIAGIKRFDLSDTPNLSLAEILGHVQDVPVDAVYLYSETLYFSHNFSRYKHRYRGTLYVKQPNGDFIEARKIYAVTPGEYNAPGYYKDNEYTTLKEKDGLALYTLVQQLMTPLIPQLKKLILNPF